MKLKKSVVLTLIILVLVLIFGNFSITNAATGSKYLGLKMLRDLDLDIKQLKKIYGR